MGIKRLCGREYDFDEGGTVVVSEEAKRITILTQFLWELQFELKFKCYSFSVSDCYILILSRRAMLDDMELKKCTCCAWACASIGGKSGRKLFTTTFYCTFLCFRKDSDVWIQFFLNSSQLTAIVIKRRKERILSSSYYISFQPRTRTVSFRWEIVNNPFKILTSFSASHGSCR